MGPREQRLHVLDPVPIPVVRVRWIDEYTERHVAALVDLQNDVESGDDDRWTTGAARSERTLRG
jgi:hypothetical protein